MNVDQQVTGEQVGPQPDRQREQAQEVGEDLEREDQDQIGPPTPPGIRLLRYPMGPWCVTPS